jgi:hypothetical protein
MLTLVLAALLTLAGAINKSGTMPLTIKSNMTKLLAEGDLVRARASTTSSILSWLSGDDINTSHPLMLGKPAICFLSFLIAAWLLFESCSRT